jgi:hypothetical protein
MSTRRNFNNQASALVLVSVIVVVHLCASATDASTFLKKQGNHWELQVRKGLLGEFVEHLEQEHRVIISGMEAREKEMITLTAVADSMPDIMKRLLLHLGEKNFAFEYTDNRLSRVLVLPGGTEDIRNLSTIVSSQIPSFAESLDAVEIIGIIEGSQAQKLDIRKGDLLLEYDGMKINRASELVEETKKRSTADEIELVLLRNGDPVRLNAKGGFLGVQIKTVKIFTEELVGIHERF